MAKAPAAACRQVSGALDVVLKDHSGGLDGKGPPKAQRGREVVGGAPDLSMRQSSMAFKALPRRCQDDEGALPKVIQVVALPALELAEIRDIRVEGQEDEGQLRHVGDYESGHLLATSAPLELGLEVEAEDIEGEQLLDTVGQRQPQKPCLFEQDAREACRWAASHLVA